jgi:metallophosphoesterase (TIGR00282 family)
MPESKNKLTNGDKDLRVLFIGDIVGEVGRRAVKKLLPKIKEKHAVDYTIANGEHLSERVGLDIEFVNEMHQAGVDLFTTGNHVWRKREFEEHIGRADVPVIRPANFVGDVPGDGFRIVRTKKGNLLVANLIGQEHIEARGILYEEGAQRVNSPFDIAEKIIADTKGYRFSLLDFHAEMTSEKVAMGRFLDGRYGAVVGTHTHVPTADAQILPNGTAYVSDVGMTGPSDSVLGVKSEIIIERFRNGLPQKFEVADGPAVFNAVLITFNEDGKASQIKRVDLRTV